MTKTLKRDFTHLFFFLICAIGISGVTAAWVPMAHAQKMLYTQQKTISLPISSFGCFDIGIVHQNNYYLADADTKSILKINLSNDSYTGNIDKDDFTGRAGCLQYDYSAQGPEGVLVDKRQHLWAGDGNSSVHIYNIQTGKLLKVIFTGGQKRADEFGYSPERGIIAVTNPDETIPFLTLIDAKTYRIIKQISFPTSTQGIEQPVWDARTGLFYVDLLGARGASTGSLLGITPYGTIKKTIRLQNCEPAGMTLGGDDLLAIACTFSSRTLSQQPQLLISLQTGKTISIDAGVGIDVVSYDPTTQRYFYTVTDTSGLFWSVAVIDKNGKVLQHIPTTLGAHTVNISNGRVLIPEVGRGIVVWSLA